MLRLVLADDEELARITLKNNLANSKLPEHEIYEAENGVRLLELVKEHQPDIAFVDIRMPELDGLASIQQAKKYSPKTQWIIVTGFPEFDYAARAIELNVSGYLLKPLEPAALERELHKAMQLHNSVSQQVNRQFENCVRNMLEGMESEEAAEYLSDYRHFWAGIFIFDSCLDEHKKGQKIKAFLSDVRMEAGKSSRSGYNSAIAALSGGELCIVFAARQDDGKPHILKLMNNINELAKSYSGEYFSTSILYTDEAFEMRLVHSQIDTILSLAYLRHLIKERYISKAELTKFDSVATGKNKELCQKLEELADAYTIKSFLFYAKAAGELSPLLCNYAKSVTAPEREWVERRLRCIVGIDVKLDQGIELLQKSLLQAGQNLAKLENPGAPDVMEEVMLYVDNHYTEDITVNGMSEKFHISPSYFSVLFRRHCGETFLKYITRLRMIKAKELLLNKQTTIPQAAELLGYHSSRHFTKLFVEYYGEYPSDYRRKQASDKV